MRCDVGGWIGTNGSVITRHFSVGIANKTLERNSHSDEPRSELRGNGGSTTQSSVSQNAGTLFGTSSGLPGGDRTRPAPAISVGLIPAQEPTRPSRLLGPSRSVGSDVDSGWSPRCPLPARSARLPVGGESGLPPLNLAPEEQEPPSIHIVTCPSAWTER